MIYLTRRYRFAASHRLHSDALSAEANARVYGKCNNPYGHGHNYVLEVTVAGEVDPATGMVYDLGALDQTVEVRIARRLLVRCRELTREVNALEREITSLVRTLVPELLAVPGCGPLTAGKILGEVAGVTRFSSEAKLALHAGVAPLEVSSGERRRHRLNRTGNRQLNTSLHRIAVTQVRMHDRAKIYIARRMSEGLTKREALRCLKRHLAKIVYRRLGEAERRRREASCPSTDTVAVAAA